MTENWIADALAAGLDPSSLKLHLQPVVSLASDRIVGAESFIRWRDSLHGLVPPSDWIPLAESTGAIVDCALTALPLWTECSNPGTGRLVSFNLDGRQLLAAEFMDAMLEIPAEVAAGLAVEIPYLQFAADWANRVALEHRAQLEFAQHAGVELAQGFLYAAPLTPSAFAAYVHAHARTALG